MILSDDFNLKSNLIQLGRKSVGFVTPKPIALIKLLTEYIVERPLWSMWQKWVFSKEWPDVRSSVTRDKSVFLIGLLLFTVGLNNWKEYWNAQTLK